MRIIKYDFDAYVIFGVSAGVIYLYSPKFHCLSSLWHFVCLVDGFRYNGLATLTLAAFGRMRALRARAGASRPRERTAFGGPCDVL